MGKKKKDKTESIAPKKSRKVPLLFVALILLATLAAGGWYTYTTYFQSGYPKKDLAYVDLDDAVLRFAWAKVPDVYFHMVNANSELALMEDEIDRIKGVKKNYPRQEKIASSEIKRWEKGVQKLSGQLNRFQSQVEALYVTFRVNPEKGSTAIDEKRVDLATSMREVLEGVQEQTAPLKSARVTPDGFKGVIAKIKNRFL
ncbi:hypothetical protein DSLASN_09560 [Desulfoluna limicola]|uniref:Chemotaxis methyl-accepting receptor HlyB-like 4HB MCP domain-containing protein n=1 Tax=Desulfoluna limicola TaxID=2810562 RepID=A0ABM7PDT7_9BACT|nr:hypothetical protein [Desulfoluna limicola]BCS95324.1 hypothetical protein DSLASN_09560 [Desulfoluna limicola]